MADRPEQVVNEHPQAHHNDGPIATVPLPGEQGSHSAKAEPRNGNRSRSAVNTPHISDAEKNNSGEDLEQGIRADTHSTDTSSSTEPPIWTTRPRLTIIDVDASGNRMKHPRMWVNDPASSEPKIPDLATSCVRITMKELAGIQNADTYRIFEDFDNKKPGNRRNKLTTPTRFFSEVARPFLQHMSESVILKYIGGRKFSMRQLQDLWREESDGFLLQANFLETSFGEEIAPPGEDDYPEKGSLLMLKKIFNSGSFSLSTPFWESYTTIKISQLDDQRAEVYLEFPALSFNSVSTQSLLELLSPAQRDFEEMLFSTRSALQFSTGNSRLTCHLVLLDLMRSTLGSWETFFHKLSFQDTYQSGALRSYQLIEELENDVGTSNTISYTIRDSNACFSFLIACIQTQLENERPANENPENVQHQSNSSWIALANEIRSLNQELRDMAQDLVERSNQNLSFFVANLNERQANSARRLTVVASIFLPLTLSASLMAMTTNVKAIGDLWYDWVGLCVVTGAIILTFYSIWEKAENITSKRPWKYLRIFSTWTIKAISMPWGYMLLAVVAASFIGGMFHARKTAVDILKYGFAAVVAFAVLWLMKKIIRKAWILIWYVTAGIQLYWNFRRRGGRLRRLVREQQDLQECFTTGDGKSLVEALATTKWVRRYISEEKDVVELLTYVRTSVPRFDETLGILQGMAAENPEVDAMLKELLRAYGDAPDVPSRRI